MSNRRRAIAIITVLMVSAVILTFVLGGLNLASQHLFQVSSLHNRHRALYAAEIGVCRARYALENNLAYAGTLDQVLEPDSKFRAEVSHVGNRAVIRSQGSAGGQQQTLRVTLSLDADSYNAVSSKADLKVFDDCFVNGIRSLADPRSARGNVYARSRIDVTSSTGERHLSFTGRTDAPRNEVYPSVQRALDPPQVAQDGSISTTTPNKSTLLSGASGSPNYIGNTLSRSGTVGGDLERSQPLHIPAGKTLYVKGDCILHGGVTGEGTLVVDGTLLMRANSNLREDTPKGLMVYAERDVVIAHPRAKVDKNEETSKPSGWDTQNSEVGALFAGMPAEVPYLLSQRLPPGAPSDSSFFEWYGQMTSHPTPAFSEWVNGDGTSLNPGLSQEVRDWLTEAVRLSADIERQAPP